MDIQIVELLSVYTSPATTIPSSAFIIIDHTEVDAAFEGRGVGKQLLYKVVEMAREKKVKILPLCPFASAMFKKLDDIQDVLKK